MGGDPIEPAELLQSEWPVHLMGEILNRLLGVYVVCADLVHAHHLPTPFVPLTPKLKANTARPNSISFVLDARDVKHQGLLTNRLPARNTHTHTHVHTQTRVSFHLQNEPELTLHLSLTLCSLSSVAFTNGRSRLEPFR